MTGEPHHKVELPAQAVRMHDQIIYQSDAVRRNPGEGQGLGQAVGSMLNKGFSKVTSVFGGMANSMQQQVSGTYNEPPPGTGL